MEFARGGRVEPSKEPIFITRDCVFTVHRNKISKSFLDRLNEGVLDFEEREEEVERSAEISDNGSAGTD